MFMANALASLVAGHNRFGFDLFAAATGGTGGKNVVLSPTSVFFALGMTWNGSAGETRKEQGRVLGLSKMSPEKANDGFSALRAKLSQEMSGVEIAEADSLWVAREVSLQPAFQELCRRIFGAEVESVDFSDPAAAQAIVDWALRKTRGKVDLTPFSAGSSTTLVLVNAIFFQGLWTQPFDPEETHERPFTLPDGSKKNVPMMFRSGGIEVLERRDFQAARIPYGKQKRFVFEVYLPAEKRSLQDLLSDLTADRWESLVRDFKPAQKATLGLPRFAFSWREDLVESLQSLGMKAAFSDADFTPMAPDPMFISQVLHQARVEVDEMGTTAAAATVIVMTRGGGGHGFVMIVNRPFFWAIRDLETGAALFLGVVVDPTAG